MKKKSVLDRNLNPRPNAVFAMYHWPADYAAQNGGSMDFYDALHPGDQEYCNEAVTAIINMALNWGLLGRQGKEATRKPCPRLARKRSSPMIPPLRQ